MTPYVRTLIQMLGQVAVALIQYPPNAAQVADRAEAFCRKAQKCEAKAPAPRGVISFTNEDGEFDRAIVKSAVDVIRRAQGDLETREPDVVSAARRVCSLFEVVEPVAKEPSADEVPEEPAASRPRKKKTNRKAE